MSKSLITVIMPLKYYHPEFLKKSVQSITQQSCPDWNLSVVVEPADLAKFGKLFERDFPDPRNQVIANQGFRFPGAINTGMKQAKTPFVSILLADDMWSNDAIETLNRYIIDCPQVDFFHSSRIIIDENDMPISSVYRSKETFSLNDFRWGSPVKHLLCWRREKGISVGGIDEGILKAQDDYDFPWTMAENGAVFKALNECLYYYRNHLECERLTTHRPLSVTKQGIRGILKKHGVGVFTRTCIVEIMRRRGTLGKQCIYRNTADRWIKETLHCDPKRGWKKPEYKKTF
jgi:glycosyltransferase involved in cell wall biosynthesis